MTDGGTFNFPPREQPTHAGRRALISALQVVKSKNDMIPNVNQRDWVSVISFDKKASGSVIHQALTGNYTDAMQACTQLQAVSDISASTTTEGGLVTAQQHLSPTSEGGSGRKNANKVVVLMTDGVANQYVSSGSTISSYMSNNPSSNFYGSNNNLDAPLMQADLMRVGNTLMFPVGLGLGTDYNFMDRMARINDNADDNGQSPRGSGNPAQYEQRLKDIFTQIIITPKVRLVQ